MAIDFLTDAELEDLTGYTQPSKQRAVLDNHGIYYVVRATDGKLRVTPHHVNNPYRVINKTADQATPDFSALGKVG